MNTRLKNKQNLRQVLLLITAQTLAVASMIWGGSLSVDASERPGVEQIVGTATADCDNQQATTAGKQKSRVKLLDFSIGSPWG